MIPCYGLYFGRAVDNQEFLATGIHVRDACLRVSTCHAALTSILGTHACLGGIWYRLASANPRWVCLQSRSSKPFSTACIRHIIFSNTENIVSSFPSVDSPIAGNKTQDAHSHRLCLHSSYNYTKRKNTSHHQLSTLPEWVAGTLSSSAEPWLLQSWRTCAYFRPCSFLILDEVPIPSQAGHIQSWEGVCTQLADHMDGLPGYRGC